MSHSPISLELLLAFAAEPHGLPADQRSLIENHLRNNPADAATVHSFRLVQSITASDDSHAVPPSVIQRAQALFASRAFAQDHRSIAHRLCELVARLVYDSRLQPAAVRFVGPLDRILLSFETQNGEIELQALSGVSLDEPQSTPRWRILGQLGGDLSLVPGRVELRDRSSATVVAAAQVAADGAFELLAHAGVFDLHLLNVSKHVCAPGIDLP